MSTTKMKTTLQVRTKPAPDAKPRASNAINSGANMVFSAAGHSSPTLKARAYQTEMYEKSIEDNIIVVVCFFFFGFDFMRGISRSTYPMNQAHKSPPHPTRWTRVQVRHWCKFLPLQVSGLMTKDARHGMTTDRHTTKPVQHCESSTSWPRQAPTRYATLSFSYPVPSDIAMTWIYLTHT